MREVFVSFLVLLVAVALSVLVLGFAVYAAAYYPTIMGITALVIIGAFVIAVVAIIARS